MNIDSIKNGIVIDHITAGKSFLIYSLLGLDKLGTTVALIKNAASKKSGKKDIIKVDGDFYPDTDILGFVDPGATVNIIKDSVIVEKKTLALPEKLVGVIKCKNPDVSPRRSRSFPIYSSLLTEAALHTGAYTVRAKEKDKYGRSL